MNLPFFLKRVDLELENTNDQRLRDFIHEEARIMPENERDAFLDRLNSFLHSGNVSNHTDSFSKAEIDELIYTLHEIDSGNLKLYREFNEDYDNDWEYRGIEEEEEYYWHDQDGVLKTLNQSASLVHRLTDIEKFREAAELGASLIICGIQIEGDYSDHQKETIFDLNMDHILSFEPEDTMKDVLFAAYMAFEGNQRCEMLYRICGVKEYGRYEFLEEIMQMGNGDLPGFDEFLTEWISFLAAKNGRAADQLLEEAVSLCDNAEMLAETAARSVSVHPEMYSLVLKNMPGCPPESKLAFAADALEKIHPKYTVRGEIALMAAEYAMMCKAYDKAQAYRLEAFRSSTNPVNYLRCVLNTEPPSKITKALKKMIAIPKTVNGSLFMEKKNVIPAEWKFALMIMSGDYEKAVRDEKRADPSREWNRSFTDLQIMLILTMLYQGNIKDSRAVSSMEYELVRKLGFDAKEYNRSLSENSRSESLSELLQQDAGLIPVSSEQKQECLCDIEALIADRVSYAVSFDRKLYGECARYISALAEVYHSLGLYEEEKKIKNRYTMDYSRYPALMRSLAAYGITENS